jgi:putative nucleotidyltransferase with HDIG domain
LLKRIPSSDLRVGMFVEEFCGSWMDHPFWRARFAINGPADLEKIRSSGVSEVWIDASKGADVAVDQVPVVDRQAADAQVQTRLDAVQARPAERLARSADLQSELERASKIFQESRRHVTSMFDEARLGTLAATDRVEAVVDNIADSVARNPMAMIGLSRLKSADDYTFMHSMAVSAMMVALARTLGFDEARVRDAGLSGLLHDVGKAQIPASILNKPGTLDDVEWKTMRSHSERGHAILSETRGVTPGALDAVMHHHEKIDGTGYPHRLTGERISELAKMAAVCDVYDAVTSERPYKCGWQPTAAIRKMTEWTGHFDSTIFKAFVKTVGIYPVGSLVRLKSQRLAVVVDHDPAHLLQPTVKIFFSLRSMVHIEPMLVKLDKAREGDQILGYEDPEAHGFTHFNDLWVPPGTKVP